MEEIAFERYLISGYVKIGRGCSRLRKNKSRIENILYIPFFPICFKLHTYSKPLLFLSVFIRAGNAYTWAAFLVVHGITLLGVWSQKDTKKMSLKKQSAADKPNPIG